MNTTNAVIFEIAEKFLKKCDPEIAQRYAMSGIKEKKCLFGLLSFKCQYCLQNMQYYCVLGKALDVNKKPAGQEQPFPFYAKNSSLLPGAILPLNTIGFGVCPAGHKTATVKGIGDMDSRGWVTYPIN